MLGVHEMRKMTEFLLTVCDELDLDPDKASLVDVITDIRRLKRVEAHAVELASENLIGEARFAPARAIMKYCGRCANCLQNLPLCTCKEKAE